MLMAAAAKGPRKGPSARTAAGSPGAPSSQLQSQGGPPYKKPPRASRGSNKKGLPASQKASDGGPPSALSSLMLTGAPTLPPEVLRDSRLSPVVSFHTRCKVPQLASGGPLGGPPVAGSPSRLSASPLRGPSHQQTPQRACYPSSKSDNKGAPQRGSREGRGPTREGSRGPAGLEAPKEEGLLELTVVGVSSLMQVKEIQHVRRLPSRSKSSSSSSRDGRWRATLAASSGVAAAAASEAAGGSFAAVPPNAAAVSAAAPPGAASKPPLLSRLLLPPPVSVEGSPWAYSTCRSPAQRGPPREGPSRGPLDKSLWGPLPPAAAAAAEAGASAATMTTATAPESAALAPSPLEKPAASAASAAAAAAAAAGGGVALKGSEIAKAWGFLASEAETANRNTQLLLRDLAAATAAQKRLASRLQALKEITPALDRLTASVARRRKILEQPFLLTAFEEGPLDNQQQQQQQQQQVMQLEVAPHVAGKAEANLPTDAASVSAAAAAAAATAGSVYTVSAGQGRRRRRIVVCVETGREMKSHMADVRTELEKMLLRLLLQQHAQVVLVTFSSKKFCVRVTQYPAGWPDVLTESVFLDSLSFIASMKAETGSLQGPPSHSGATASEGPLLKALKIGMQLNPDILYLIAHTAPAQAAEREAVFAALNAHASSALLSGQGAPLDSAGGGGAPRGEKPFTDEPATDEGGPQGGPPRGAPMNLRFCAFKWPLASQQDTDFFLGLLHAAGQHGCCPAAKEGEQPDCGPLQGGDLPRGDSPAAPDAAAAADTARRSAAGRKQQRQQQKKRGGSAAAAAAAAAAAEQQAASPCCSGGPLPRGFVAIDLVRFKNAIAKDEKTCSSLLARVEAAKDLSASEQQLQNGDLREKLHTEIALMRVIAEDKKKARHLQVLRSRQIESPTEEDAEKQKTEKAMSSSSTLRIAQCLLEHPMTLFRISDLARSRSCNFVSGLEV
ncbi:hypothetical protein Efla_003280 [Eimeria flavescens]